MDFISEYADHFKNAEPNRKLCLLILRAERNASADKIVYNLMLI